MELRCISPFTCHVSKKAKNKKKNSAQFNLIQVIGHADVRRFADSAYIRPARQAAFTIVVHKVLGR